MAGDYKDRDLQCQHEGGSCDFFLICWMSNGLLQGSCNGIMRGCCHRTAKSANSGTNDIVDLTDLPKKDYGPVKNDASEWCLIFTTTQTTKKEQEQKTKKIVKMQKKNLLYAQLIYFWHSLQHDSFLMLEMLGVYCLCLFCPFSQYLPTFDET